MSTVTTGTVNSGPDNPSPTINNQADFARALLARLGIQPNSGNVTAIVAWERAEGGNWNNSASYNPLNTTQPAPGSRSINGVGVMAYPSWATGVDATTQTLQNGRYGPILAALKGSDPYAVATAVGASPWGTPDFSNLIGSSAGSTNPSQGGAVGQVTAMPVPDGVAGSGVDDHCIVSWPSQSLPLVGSIGGGCAIGTPTARAILGGAIIVAGVGIGVVGLAVIVTGGLAGSKLAAAARPVAAAAGGRARRAPSPEPLTDQDLTDLDTGLRAKRSAKEAAESPTYAAGARRHRSQAQAARKARRTVPDYESEGAF